MVFQSLQEGLIMKWGLSEEAAALLSARPELVERLSEAKKKPPLALTPGVPPERVDYLMDDLPYICMENGRLTYYREWEAGLEPLFWELQINDEIAVFAINGEYIVNRLQVAANTIIPQWR